MNIENPISTIRKAIKGSAETTAKEENLEKPTEKHYKETFKFYRLIKILQPEIYEKMIVIGSKGKELSDEMGKDLYNTFIQVLEESTADYDTRMAAVIKFLEKNFNLTPDEFDEQLLNNQKRMIKLTGMELKNDERLKQAFSGKEQLLNRVIEFEESSMIELLETDAKYPNIIKL